MGSLSRRLGAAGLGAATRAATFDAAGLAPAGLDTGDLGAAVAAFCVMRALNQFDANLSTGAVQPAESAAASPARLVIFSPVVACWRGAPHRVGNGMKAQALWLFGWLSLLAASGGPAYAQVGYDRPGGDYTSAPSRSGDPAQCAARCERDSRCRAWAFSYPATENANAICWLKSRVTPRVAATCCVSGVRGAGIIEMNSGPIA